MATAVPTVTFVRRLPHSDRPVFYVSLGQEPTGVEPRYNAISLTGRLGSTEELRALYVDWLGTANVKNAGLRWWAHTSTAKNFLSSPLANEVVQTLALTRVLAADETRHLFVVGASDAQVETIRAWAGRAKPELNIIDRRSGSARPPWALMRLAYQTLRILAWWLFRQPPVGPAADIYLFTYVDGGFRDGHDAFFGELAARLKKLMPDASVLHLAHVQAPYGQVVPLIERASIHHYQLLLAELRPSDIGTACFSALRALLRGRSCAISPIAGLNVDPLLRRALAWDVAQGGYLLNFLIYCAAKRFARRCRPARVIYPYENKSLEKMLLLGLREGHAACRIIGYQHTSVTPRHATLLFASGEAAATPLPDRILTTGRVTLEYLLRLGRYPEGMLAEGCALRQPASAGLKNHTRVAGCVRLLAALSSSRFELESAIRFLIAVKTRMPGCELGIRPHPEFPLSKLPRHLSAWVAANATDLSGTPLQDNLDWCDVTAYVSSTVALESLLAGRPAIHIAIGDNLDPDPVIDGPGLHRRTEDVDAFICVLVELMEIGDAALEVLAGEAFDYARRYFSPPTDSRIRAFLA
ncbi:MAG: hypothetical protein EXR27_08415 [Betaproteobacteria bacterium]|nr:hypothetical protein [Betaproteobacteria bacterium]